MAYSVVISKSSKRPNPPQPPSKSGPSKSTSSSSPPVAANLPKKKSPTEPGVMDARYYRPASPRYRIATPARASTGTFADPYHEPAYYGRTSPRTSGERLTVPVPHGHHYGYAPSSSSSSRSGSHKYDSYSGRPRRNTLNESDDRLVRPQVKELAPKALPIHVPGGHRHHHSLHEPPTGYLSRSFDGRPDPIITHGPPKHHSRIYSIDDNSRKAELIADREIVEPRRRDHEPRGYSITSGGKPYYYDKPSSRSKDVDDDGYSYTDPASMYRDTEPVWRRPRGASTERSRPTSMTLDRGPRTSNRELGPPPSTRGFDKINASAHRDHHHRSSSIDRSREVPKYDPYPETSLGRSSSTRHKAPAVHQEPREQRRDTYEDEYGRRDRDVESRRVPSDRFEDRDVASRGFGIAPGHPSLAQDNHALDRQPVWTAQDVEPPRRLPPDNHSGHYHSADRAEARMPEPRIPRERDVPSTYDERPRDRDREIREREPDDRGHNPVTAPVAAASAAAVTYGAAEVLKSRERDREAEREREREREKRKEWDERDRRGRADRPDERRDTREQEARRERREDERLPLAAAAYVSTQDPNRGTRERRYDEEEGAHRPRERRSDEDDKARRTRGSPSSDASGEGRARHYVDRDAARESERRRESKDATLDPDEEYRRRIQLEAERSGRGGRESEADRDKERRRRREEREQSRDHNTGSRSSPPQEATRSRHDERSGSVFNKDFVEEPESLNSQDAEHQPSKSVQIVAPPKDPQPQPKGILRKPTEKFPEDPDPIREGVAPHKSALKGKDIPPGARWTKIDRRLVNPEALEEAKERFEERMDCVIVLRVLTKQEIQKLADRTKEIREAREEEIDRYERRDRDSRRHRSHRDDEDRERRGDYDDTDDDDVGRRGRDRDRDRPRMIEAGR